MILPECSGRDRTAYKPYRKRFLAYTERYGEFVGADLWSGLSDKAMECTELLDSRELQRRGGWQLLLDCLDWNYMVDLDEELDEAGDAFLDLRRVALGSTRAYCLKMHSVRAKLKRVDPEMTVSDRSFAGMMLRRYSLGTDAKSRIPSAAGCPENRTKLRRQW